MTESYLTAIDVCAGAGGWAVAARGLPIRIVAAFDRDEACLATYGHNHPDTECVQCDVMTHNFSAWYGVDLILGGIPCEDISAARRGTPLRPEQADAFRALVERCVQLPDELGARYWCYEDVVDVVKFAPLFTPHFILDACTYSPQRRKRCWLGNVPKPAKGKDRRTLDDCLRPGPYRRNPRLDGRSPGRGNVYNSQQFYPWYPEQKSPTVIGLTSRHDNYAAAPHGDTWRNLEWQELARLQGFPENYLFIGSPSSVTKQVAQAVQIDTARAILEALLAEVFFAKRYPNVKLGGERDDAATLFDDLFDRTDNSIHPEEFGGVRSAVESFEKGDES